MKYPNKEMLEKLRRDFPKGATVELLKMDDVQAPPIGTKGIVRSVDHIGTSHVVWESGSGLGVVLGEDLCRVIK